MRKSKFTVEQILAILREVDRDRVTAVAERHGISKQTIYVWKKRYGLLKDAQNGNRPDSLKERLGEPWASDLEDFCAVHYGAPEINIIREAIRAFIDDRLAREIELKKRFEHVRQRRIEKSARKQDSRDEEEAA